jgi:hypothetical protein
LFMLALSHSAHAAPADSGAWSPVYQLPVVPIHAHVLSDGNVLFWQDDDVSLSQPSTNYSKAYVVSIPAGSAPGAPTYYPNSQTNLFCAGHAMLPDGRLLAIGGQEKDYYIGVSTATFFHTAGGYRWETLTNSPMRDRRWYPSAITLATGEILALGGTKTDSGNRNLIPEVWKTTGGWRALTTASLGVAPYAWVFQAPNGKVFMAGPTGSTRYLSTAGTGAWSSAPARKQADRTRGAAVMYAAGKILLVGGNGTASAEKIDLLSATPAWQTVTSMKFPRIYHHATVLPDGTVLVTGGQNPNGPVLAAELWNPLTGSWTTMSAAQLERRYHSVGLLLPDGRVMVGGGGRKNGLTDQRNMEIFSPPYLFKGARPIIGTAPTSVTYNQTFQVSTAEAANISKVSLIKLSLVTHSFNMGQRFNDLTFTKGTNTLSITSPTNANLAPPGHYMLFIVSSVGVPSVAKIIQIR